LIQEVVPGSAAEAAGLRPARRWVIVSGVELGIGGDLIMAIEGRKADRTDALLRAINRKRPGDRIELSIFRNGRRTTVRVELDEAPE
jgi:S1-C subfamily serine protease